VLSGFPTDSFFFLGFLPNKKRERCKLLASIRGYSNSLVAFEAPHRIVESLQDMQDSLGNRRLAVCRELTKIHEEIFRGTIDEALRHFTSPRGEFTLVIEGNTQKTQTSIDLNMKNRITQMQKSGMTAKVAVSQLVEASGLSRKELYMAWIKMRKGG
jgi:16S rRNA (cytidine1402-2'-O)-methyltransferase